MKITLFVSLCLITTMSFSQDYYQARHKVFIPWNQTVYFDVDSTYKEPIPKGFETEIVYTREVGDSTYTFTKTVLSDDLLKDSTDENDSIEITKKVPLKTNGFNMKANIVEDEENPSILKVNPWLLTKKTIPKGSFVNRYKATSPHGKRELVYSEIESTDKIAVKWFQYNIDTINCEDRYEVSKQGEGLDTQVIKKEAKVHCSKQRDFVRKQVDILKKNSPEYIEVRLKEDTSKNKTIYSSIYSSAFEYYIKLENRDFISFKERSFNIGAVTIPFKIRPGQTLDDGTIVPGGIEADLNVGVFAGYYGGRYRRRYETGKLLKLANVGGTVGPFLSLSSTTLDSTSTVAGQENFTGGKERTIAVLTPGIGAMFTIYNIDLGFFVGVDLGMGVNAKNWNYHKKPWFGIGFGYTLKGGFWKGDG